MKRNIWIGIGVVVVVALAIVLIVTQAKKEPEEIKIGAILPLTGPAASLGEQFRNGMLFAVEKINQQDGIHGVKINLRIEDGQGDPKVSLAVFKKLIEIEKIKIIEAPLSSVAMTLLPLVDQYDVLLFADAAHPEITGKSKYVFRHSQTATLEANVIGKLVLAEPNLSSIVLAIMTDDYGIAFQKEFIHFVDRHKEKIKLKGIVQFQKEEKDFLSVATKILDYKPNVVIIAGFEEGLGLLTRRLRELGFKGKIVGTIAFSTPSARNAAGEAAIGVYHTDLDINLSDPEIEKISIEFQNRFNRKLTPFSILAYNTILLITKALRETGSQNRDVLSNYLRNLGHFEGLAEKIEIKPNGDINPSLRIVQLQK